MENLLATPATLVLIITNLIVSYIGFTNKDFFERNVFWIGPIRQHGQWERFVSSAFLHVNTIHLLINMYVLYEFGRILERVLGTPGFLLLYVASLLAGNAWKFFAHKNHANYRAVGASGATSGIILGFCLFFPFATLLLFFVIPMWAIVLAILFIVGSFILSRRDGSIIAHGAHLGGAIAGLLVTVMLRPDVLGNLIQQVAETLGT